MDFLDALPDSPFTDALRELAQRIDNTDLFVSELADEMGSRLAETREFLEQRKVCEALLMESFGFTNAEAFYWRKSDVNGWRQKNLHEPGLRRGDYRNEANTYKVAQVMLYYILYMHCAGASFREMERIYGYSRNRVRVMTIRLEDDAQYRRRRRQIERAFLDALGRTDEPVSEYDLEGLRRVSEVKSWCKDQGIPYTYSLTLTHDH